MGEVWSGGADENCSSMALGGAVSIEELQANGLGSSVYEQSWLGKAVRLSRLYASHSSDVWALQTPRANALEGTAALAGQTWRGGF